MPDTFPDACLNDLAAVLQQLQPRTALVVTSSPDALEPHLDGLLPAEGIEVCGPDAVVERLSQLSTYDVVALLSVIEQMDKQAAEKLIGSLRDLHARHLFVLAPIGTHWPGQVSHWRQSDMLALGLSMYRTYQQEHGLLQWYRFELESYKATPEWLNSKYWANPELFGKYRW